MDATLKKLGPLTGVVFVVLYVVSSVITMKGSPEFAGKPAEILAYYQGHEHQIMLGGLLDIISTPFWFIFLGCLRSGMGAAEGGAGRLTATAFGAGVAGAAVGVAGTVMNVMAAIRSGKGTLDASAATVYFDATQVLVYTATAAVLSAFVLALGIASFRYGAIIPKWLGAVSVLLAIAFVIPPISWAALQLGLIIVLWASIVLYRQKAGEL
jgi:hypothetical protein